MPGNRRYIVEPETTEEVAGFNCLCYSGDTYCGKRFFRTKDAAEEYGEDWAFPAITNRHSE